MIFSPATPIQAEFPQHAVSPSTAVPASQTQLTDAVGMGLQDPITEAEIDAHIKSLGELADRAYKDGDPHGARIWAHRMYTAIKGRSAAHQARLQAEVDRRIDEGVCYFSSEYALEQGRRRGLK